jgi:acetyl-CoA synthetase
MKEKNILGGSLEAMWEEKAKSLEWFKKWKKVLEWNAPFAKWFIGGTLNASYLCLDYHIKNGLQNKVAFYWEDELGNKKRLTYLQLYEKVNKFSYALKRLGVKKGDIVVLYMPMIPEAIIAMLSVARIGAIHSVIFSGFSSRALQDRINDMGAKFVITADFVIRRSRLIPLKESVDLALKGCKTVQSVVVVNRFEKELVLQQGRDFLYKELIDHDVDYVEPEAVDSNHPLYILYTSGTTGKPKGIVHSTGGYLVYVYHTFKTCFGPSEKMVYWCTADIGWITGHSYVVYAPLMHGTTSVIYEGAPNYPDVGVWWKLIETYKVTTFYTAPTAIRMFMQYTDAYIKKSDLSSLQVLGSVGEVLNSQAWEWYFDKIGNKRCPIIDTWWQTETGGFMLAPTIYHKINDFKPGSVMFPLQGIEAEVFASDGNPVEPGKKGFLVIKKPWPGMMIGVYNNEEKYKEIYWSKFADVYYSGDYAIKGKDGYFWLLGRADETLNIAGHRIGTAEIEQAVVSNMFVTESAVAAISDEIKGNSFIIFAVLKQNVLPSEEIKAKIIFNLRKSIGAFVKPKGIYFVDGLPKTRSGKILRRVLKSIIQEQNLGDVSTLENEVCIDEITRKVRV